MTKTVYEHVMTCKICRCYRLFLDADAILNKIPEGKHKETLSSGPRSLEAAMM